MGGEELLRKNNCRNKEKAGYKGEIGTEDPLNCSLVVVVVALL